jgi:hypothetical protein
MKNFAKTSPLYKYRFQIGFGLLAVFATIFAALDFAKIPNGLAATEITSATAASKLNLATIFGGSDFANFPFLALQHFAINLFGFTTFAFRLPSVILMLLAIAAITFALVRYNRKNIAVMTGFLLVSSPLFMSLARSGSSGSMTIFLLSAIMLISIIIASGKFHRWQSATLKILLCIFAALLVYSPGGIFIIALFVAIGLLSPKTRYEVFRNKSYKLVIGSALSLAIISPLFISALHGHFDWNLVGFAHWNFANSHLAFGLFFIIDGGLIGGIIAPALNAAVIVLVAYGIFRLARAINSARARLVLPLFLFAIIFALGDPELSFWLFAPVAFALASGMDGLVGTWYDFFPKNPYARIFALPLIAVLVLSIGFSSVGGYFANDFYSSRTVSSLNREFDAVRSELSRNSAQTLIVPKAQFAFYSGLTRDFAKLSITDKVPEHFAKNTLVLSSVSRKSTTQIPTKIAADFAKNDAVLFREY